MIDSSNNSPRIVKASIGKSTTIAIAILITAMTLTGILYSYLLSDMLTLELSSGPGIIVFALLTITVFVAGIFILKKLRTVDVTGFPSQFVFFFTAVKAIFVASAVIHAIIIFEVAFSSKYHVGLSIGTMGASFLLGASIAAILSFRFLCWYGSQHDLMILLYGLSYAAIAIGLAMIAIANMATLLLTGPLQEEGPITSHASQMMISKLRGTVLSTIFLVTLIPARISFLLYWAATAVLLRNYSKYIGKARFWTIIGLPLAVYVIATMLTFSNYANSQFIRAILTLVSVFFGGLFFSVLFMTTARNLKERNRGVIVDYLRLAGFGVLLFAVSTTSPVHLVDWLQIPYPPFASAAWSFVAVAAYLYAFGVFFSASAISKDLQLRKTVKKIAMKESQFFGNIGTAAMEQELGAIVRKVIKEQETLLNEQSRLQNNISEPELKSYLDEALDELRSEQNKET